MANFEAPTQIVILGGTGDLSTRKLLPALFDLYCKNALPQTFRVLAVARTPRTNEGFRRFALEALANDPHDHGEAELERFVAHIDYVAGDFAERTLYSDITAATLAFNNKLGLCTNTLFYLAVPPEYYETIFQNLHDSKLSVPCSPETGWSRILVEKPFGHDCDSAQALDGLLQKLFREEQIFRIDHYLAKEAIQNILSFRFANTLTQHCWNNRNISSIHITMHESVDVSNRGSFYDSIGALRDVGQNHLLQLLALITMEEPDSFSAADIRERRGALLEKLVPLSASTITKQYRRAQYQDYAATKGVSSDSETETAFSLELAIDDPSWSGVPMFIETGKGLKEKSVEVRIEYKDVATGLFKTESCTTVGNQIVLTIEPEQHIAITLNTKAPGYGYSIQSETLQLHTKHSTQTVTNSYEKVLLDCISGDQTLFIGSREVLAQWRFINAILRHQHLTPLEQYQKGADTPFSD